MFNGKEVWLVIPAKKDSVGVPGKNRLILGGMPILAYTLEDASQCCYIDRIFLATNDVELTRQFPDIRNLSVPTDYFAKTPSTLTVRKAVLSSGLPDPGFVIEAYGSTPIRPAGVFSQLIEAFANPDAESAWPLEETQEHPYRLMILQDGFISGYRHNLPRQDYPPAYKVTGCAWAFRWDILKAGSEHDIDSLYGRMAGVPVSCGTIEIDSIDDLSAAEAALSKKQFLKVG